MDKMDRMSNYIIAKLEERNVRIFSLEDEVTSIKSAIRNLSNRLEHTKSYQRGDTFVFSGSSLSVESNGENCQMLILDICE